MPEARLKRTRDSYYQWSNATLRSNAKLRGGEWRYALCGQLLGPAVEMEEHEFNCELCADRKKLTTYDAAKA
jgi:hypothetical protein